ncbi:b-0-+-type amino acid transporter 1 like protein [Argiope bruennichi]|uniref:B-0-+-type amino acid transporter 1 like protein n=1 Tax=Argiope bruennichi TaxID=94029 RepID=A0A8T0F5W6_ARGBR|nr:b-0-+-type amino acid transporter 1 like protein [Argiope bruennichi]
MASALDFLSRYEDEGEPLLNRIVTGDETWIKSSDSPRAVEYQEQLLSFSLSRSQTQHLLRRKQTAHSFITLLLHRSSLLLIGHSHLSGFIHSLECHGRLAADNSKTTVHFFEDLNKSTKTESLEETLKKKIYRVMPPTGTIFYNDVSEVGGTKRFPTSHSTGSALSELPLKMAEDSHEDSPVEGIALKRRVGLVSGVALIVGTMIGSGIFVSPKGVLLRSGSVGLSLIVWAGCGILSLLGALCYAELGTMITKSGAEYSYMMDAFGPLPAFLFSWVSVLVLKPSMMAIICLSLGEYVIEPLYIGCKPNIVSIKLVATLSIGIITYINCMSVKMATRIQNFFTAAKLLAIAIIIVGGSFKLMQGHTEHLATGFQGSHASFSDIATAFYSGLWAYDGWNNLNYVTEELKNPYVNLPLAIAIGIPLVTMCYVCVNISYITVMSSAELLASEAVAVTWGHRVLGVLSFVMPISVAPVLSALETDPASQEEGCATWQLVRDTWLISCRIFTFAVSPLLQHSFSTLSWRFA